MGMPVQRHAPVIPVPAEQRAAVEALLRQPTVKPRVRERLEMVKAAALGQALATIGAWSGRAAETVRPWLGRFLGGGIAALADAPRPGRPAARARTALRRVALAAVGRVPRGGDRGAAQPRLARRRFACGRPTHTRGQLQDPAEVAAGAAELAAAGGKGGR